MTIGVATLNRNRQTPLVAEQPISLADLDAVDVLTPAVAVPANATVLGGYFIVDTASDDSGAHDLEVGDADDDDRYSVTDINLKATGATPLDIDAAGGGNGYRYPEAADITINVSQAVGGDATVFEGRLVVEYIVTGRGGYNQA